MKSIKTLLQCLYPRLCRGCNQVIPPEDIFCMACAGSVKPLPSVMFAINKSLTLKVFAISSYAPPVKDLVTKKFSGDILASYQLARLILAFTPIRTTPVDLLVPVPLHWTRYASRGFNQAYEMTKILSKQLNVPTARLVRRSRKTAFQWTLSNKDRQENVKNAFTLQWWYRFVKTDAIRDKHIVLIDDLCTTGATLVHIAKLLARDKPASITAFVGCRAT